MVRGINSDNCRNGVNDDCEEKNNSRTTDKSSHCNINKNDLSYWSSNLRGYTSKKYVVNTILDSSEFVVVGVTETHQYLDKKPEHENYTFFHKNREKVNSKGGIALGFRKDVASRVVKISEGTEGNELLFVKMNCYEVPLVVGVYYGAQEVSGEQKIRRDLNELFSELYKFDKLGYEVLLMGDFNIHIGSGLLPGNDPAVSKGGKVFLGLLEESNYSLVNTLGEGNPRTHYDVSSGTSRTLDFVLTNRLEKQTRFEIDHELRVTPYTIRVRGGETARNYCDHRAIVGEMKVKEGRRPRAETSKQWNTSKHGAKEEFRKETNNSVPELMEIVRTSANANIMMWRVNQLLDKIKMKVFGLRTVTKKKKERDSDERLLLKRTETVARAVNTMDEEKKRQMERVFIARKRANRNDDDDLLEVLQHHKTGAKMSTAEEIYKDALDYNIEVLEKNEDTSEESKRLRELKAEKVREYEQIETEESEEPLLWDEYMEVTNNVLLVKKGCYNDFAWSGHEWKTALFHFFQRLYLEEEMPETFKETKLKKLYKRKGPKSQLSSYRFIHLKTWAPKIMEKLVMVKIKMRIQEATPEMQVGGRQKSRTTEHIASVLAICEMEMARKGGIIKQDFDIQKCFDQVWLSDTLFDVVEAGVHGKQLRVLKMLHDETKISLVNDPNGAEATVRNSTGQGTGYAPPGCSLTMAKTFDEVFKAKGGEYEVDGEQLSPFAFVDDTSRLTNTAEGAKEGGEPITTALDKLALKAHPKKSIQIVMGGKKFRDEQKAKLADEPVEVQGFEMPIVEEELYLGFMFNEQGPRYSRTRSIECRIKKLRAKTAQAKMLMTDDLIQRVGWLQAVKTVYQQVLLPTATYASECYTFMTKKQKSMMETAMKESLFDLLELSQYTSYSAVLLELNMVKLQHIIDSLKIGFVNSLVNEKKTGYCLKILRTQERDFPGQGMIGEVKQLCKQYGLPDVSERPVEKDIVSEVITDKARMEIWEDTLAIRRVPVRLNEKKSGKLYFHLPKREAQLLLAYYVGELQFKNHRRNEFRKVFGDVDCVNGCGGLDDFDHMKVCPAQSVKWNEDVDIHPETLLRFLKDLENQRMLSAGLPLIFRRFESHRPLKPPPDVGNFARDLGRVDGV